MRAKWRKVIWAILAVQLFLLHLLFAEYVLRNAYRLDSFIWRAVNHFGLPYVLYGRWKQLAVLAWLASAVFVMLIHYLNYVRFRRSCIGQISIISDESVKQSLKNAVSETGLYSGGKGDTERSFLYGSKEVREPFIIGFKEPILILPEKEYSERVLHFIFLHECYHMRHKDTFYKLFMLLIQSFLWFQPLMYLLKAVGYRDVEVACDEAVVEGRDMSERKEYGYALLECMEQERTAGQAYSAYFYHGKQMMKARISAIMKEDERQDSLAYAAIVILLADVVFSFYCIGDSLYDSYREKQAQLQAESFGYDENGVPRTSFYDGYELPESFSQDAVEAMVDLEPVS
ncbi:MAG: M56 family metallopeptidase [Lachnospiraceae bacterium]|nr:M56 family metallopeptidase [Lachnospiraceae bacterium]